MDGLSVLTEVYGGWLVSDLTLAEEDIGSREIHRKREGTSERRR
jgi:hypothetical protein